jgi:hypothetical protein
MCGSQTVAGCASQTARREIVWHLFSCFSLQSQNSAELAGRVRCPKFALENRLGSTVRPVNCGRAQASEGPQTQRRGPHFPQESKTFLFSVDMWQASRQSVEARQSISGKVMEPQRHSPPNTSVSQERIASLRRLLNLCPTRLLCCRDSRPPGCAYLAPARSRRWLYRWFGGGPPSNRALAS